MNSFLFQWWRSAWNLANRPGRKATRVARQPRRRLFLETLETRDMPTVAPVAHAASGIAEGRAIQINVLANDTEPSGITLAPSSIIVSQPSHGSASVNRATGVITYTPAANFVGTVEFNYSVADTLGVRSNAALVGVVVEKPVAADDWSDTDGVTPVTISVLDNDTAPPGGATLLPGTVVIVTKPSHGTAAVNADGTITYSADPNFKGTDVFRYRVSDSAGGVSLPASVYVRVNRPVAADEWTDTDGTTPVSLNVVPQAGDPDGAQHLVPSSVTVVNQPDHGVAIANGDGSITYTASGNFSGTDSFQYTIADDNGGVSLPATFYVRVNRPTAGDEWIDTDGATPVTLSVLPDATDPDGNQHLVASSVAIVSQPANGMAVANSDGSITYTANATFSGTDSFLYTIADDNGGVSLPAAFYVRVNRPSAASLFASTNLATPVTVNVLTQSTDPDGNQHLVPGSVTIVAPAHAGLAVANGNGTITYSPNGDFAGTDTFQYTIIDDNGGVSLPATVTVAVAQPGSLNNSGASTVGTQPVSINVLAGYAGAVPLIPASENVVSAPGHGSVSINARTGAISYHAAANFAGTDTFQYTIRDKNGKTSAPVTVSVVVLRPTAGDDWTDTDGTTAVTLNVTANDTDPLGNQVLQPGSVAIVAKPAHGHVAVHANGTVTYVANAGFSGTDSFTYTIRDRFGAVSAPAHVYVRINRPTAADEWTDTDGVTPVSLNVVPSAGDPDGDQHLVASSVRIVVKPVHGVAVVHSDGSITYTANPGFAGTDVLEYTIADDNGGVSLPAHFYVRVNRPTAADEWTDTDGTTPVSLNVVADATDPDGSNHLVPSSVVIVSQPAHGHAVANPDGTITYTASGNFTGTDSFKYVISDDNGGVSLPATAFVRVNRPTAGNVVAITTGTDPATIDVLAQSTDPDGSEHLVPGSLVIVSNPAHGTVVANEDGTFTYTANAGFSGADSFRYTITDDNGGTSLPGSVSVLTQMTGAESNGSGRRSGPSM